MASYVSWGTRKALGRRYALDPAQQLAQQRLEEEYALVPGREAKALQESQFSRNLALTKEQMSSSREAGIVGTMGNLGTTALMLNYMKPIAPAVSQGLAGWNPLVGPITKSSVVTGTAPGAAAGAGTETGVALGTGAAGGVAAGNAFNAAQLAAIESGASYETIGALGSSGIPPALMDTAAMTAEGGAAATEVGASAAGTSATGVASAPAGLGIGTAAGAGAVGGFIGGKLGQPIGEAIGLGGQNERATVGGAVVGAGATWAAGAMMGAPAGPVGIAVGAVVGGVVGLVTGGKRCLIVTACTDSNSYEVEIARIYRDTYLDEQQLRGYYCLAEKIVPILERNEKVRKSVKKWLVDRLIDYGEYRIGLKSSPRILSYIISKIFLGLIKAIGMTIPRYVRVNGEVF